MPPQTWIITGILAWTGSFVFAAFGLFMGYLLPTENVMQIISPVLGVFALFGGLFIPITFLPSVMQTIAPFMPTYGVVEIARFPLLGGAFDPTWLRRRRLDGGVRGGRDDPVQARHAPDVARGRRSGTWACRGWLSLPAFTRSGG